MNPETRIAIEAHALRLMDRIAIEPDREKRLLMFQMLEKACADLGVEMPNRKLMEGISNQESKQQSTLSKILHALRVMEDLGLEYNYSKDPEEVAVQYSELSRLALANSIDLPARMSFVRAIKGELAAESRVLRNPFTGSPAKCWVFPRKFIR